MKYFIIVIIFNFSNYLYCQDLTRQDPIEKILYLKGKEGESHYYEPNELIFYTGKLYIFRLINNSKTKHYFNSNNFSKAIFTRKIQITINRKKVAEIKGNISEIELWPGHEIEWWLVPIKTGNFKDLECSIKDKITRLRHSEMGMKGTIIIK